MAKRYIDTGFLKQKWIKKLSPERKIFLIYLMLECDNAGIIELDMEDAEFWIGKKIGNPVEFLPENYILKIPETDKYIIPKFIEWQYGDLKSDKNIVRQARQLLNKYGLIDEYFTLNLHKLNVSVTLIECNNTNSNGNNKGNSKSKDKKEKIKFGEFVTLEKSEHENLINQYGQHWTNKIIQKLDNYKGSSGKQYKSDYRAILTWVIDDIKKSDEYRQYVAKMIRNEKTQRLLDNEQIGKQLQNKFPDIKLVEDEK